MIEELIARVFHTRNAAHMAHWQATGAGSYARHVALGDFYDSVIGALDDFVEAHMGAFGLVGTPKPVAMEYGDIVALMSDDVRWIKANYSLLTSDITALGNLLDSVSDSYLKALYKLKNLS